MVTANQFDAPNQDNLLSMAPRVISLVPSVTETLLSWNVTPLACTRFCEQASIQSVGGTKDPKLDTIIQLAPDLVVMEREENLREHYEELTAEGIRVHVMHVDSLTGLSSELKSLATAVGVTPQVMNFGEAAELRVRAFVPIWRKPWMALGRPTYAASLLAHLGIMVVPFDEGPYPTVTLESVKTLRPDVILAPTEPYKFTKRQLPELEPVAPVRFIDGQDLFWWGTRTPEAIERLTAALADVG
jgi:ABC-type Fe3+-hydroxamate transport system substrate-binding protein